MIELTEPPLLGPPTEAVRVSYLTGQQASCVHAGTDDRWLIEASRDFARHVADRRRERVRWEVPISTYWYVAGEHYLGGLVIRHRLTEWLHEAGGHIGYDVPFPWRRQGHATRMLAAGLAHARGLGLDRVLITCAADNIASRKVILANGGRADGRGRGEDRFWIDLDGAPSHDPVE